MLISSSYVYRPSKGKGGRFAQDPMRSFLGSLSRYKPTRYINDVLRLTRFDRLLVDPLAKDMLDKMKRDNSRLSDTSFEQDIDAFFGDQQCRVIIFQAEKRAKREEEGDKFDLVILAQPENIARAEVLLSKEQR